MTKILNSFGELFMIPKIIHFCWLSGEEYPKKIQNCIDSWKSKLPDYEIKLWDKNSFNVDSIPWTKEAFLEGKYAFVSDYIRFYALYHYGGIYLDSDVEVLKSFDDFLNYKTFFSYEYTGLPEAAVVGSESKATWLKNALDWYENHNFKKKDGALNIIIAPLVFRYAFEKQYNIKLIDREQIVEIDNIVILPYYYFSPKNGYTGELLPITASYTIHHYTGSWIKKNFKVRIKKIFHQLIINWFGKKLYNKIMYKSRKKKIRKIIL